jgi:hypothetical protein
LRRLLLLVLPYLVLVAASVALEVEVSVVYREV